MQDKYVGDVGDFGKYILLNEITERAKYKIRLGINWYYVTTKETGKEKADDGRYIEYLKDDYRRGAEFKACSPNLYNNLREVVLSNRRCIAEIENRRLLREGTLFYSNVIPNSGKTPSERINDREKWFKESLSKLAKADIIFLDPDNGICIDQSKKKRKKAIKYVFPDEVEAYYMSGKSVVVYNHRDMRPKPKYDQKILSVANLVRSPNDLRVLRFRRYAVRDYIFLIQERHQKLFESVLEKLTEPPFDFLYEQYTGAFGVRLNTE